MKQINKKNKGSPPMVKQICKTKGSELKPTIGFLIEVAQPWPRNSIILLSQLSHSPGHQQLRFPSPAPAHQGFNYCGVPEAVRMFFQGTHLGLWIASLRIFDFTSFRQGKEVAFSKYTRTSGYRLSVFGESRGGAVWLCGRRCPPCSMVPSML